jgi:hypothetical protein
MRKYVTLSGIIILLAFSVLSVSLSTSFAESQTVTSLYGETSIEKTASVMSVPKDNTLPWGIVKGTIDDPAQGYPVIIQFFKGEDPVHVAQVDVKGDDGSYEYKLRVRDVNLETGKVTNIFEGNYLVKIFKVVNSSQNNLDTI